MLYTIYTRNVTKNIGDDIEIVQFADDIAVYYVERNKETSRMKIEMNINTIKKKLIRTRTRIRNYENHTCRLQ